jgi:hypothetical protein
MEIVKRRHRTKFEQFNSDGEIFCYNCKIFKDLSLYDDNQNNWYRNNKDRRCKSCKKEQYEKRRSKNRGKQDFDRIILERFHGLKDRAKRSGLEVNITLDDLKNLWNKQEGKCAISGIQMTYIFGKGRVPTNISVDRINSLEGYTKTNIQLVCMAVNQMKSDLSITELVYFCEHIVRNARSWNY